MSSESNGGLFFPALPSLRESVLWVASIVLLYFVAARLSLLLARVPAGARRKVVV
jgi:hypothetical protein